MSHAAALNEQMNRYCVSEAIGNQKVRFFALRLQTGQSIGPAIEQPHTMPKSVQKQGVQFD